MVWALLPCYTVWARDLYLTVHGQNISIADVWDGVNLKSTFRRTVNEQLMDQWSEPLEIARDMFGINIHQIRSLGLTVVESLCRVKILMI